MTSLAIELAKPSTGTVGFHPSSRLLIPLILELQKLSVFVEDFGYRTVTHLDPQMTSAMYPFSHEIPKFAAKLSGDKLFNSAEANKP